MEIGWEWVASGITWQVTFEIIWVVTLTWTSKSAKETVKSNKFMLVLPMIELFIIIIIIIIIIIVVVVVVVAVALVVFVTIIVIIIIIIIIIIYFLH